MTEVENVLKAILVGIVDYPDQINVNRTTDSQGTLIELSVDKQDMGKVIGKEGNVAKSIRTILRTVGMKNKERVSMKVLEPAGYNS